MGVPSTETKLELLFAKLTVPWAKAEAANATTASVLRYFFIGFFFFFFFVFGCLLFKRDPLIQD
jgi:hypothetical protein